MMRAAFAVAMVLASAMMAAPAWAQSETGVSAALVGDITRFSSSSNVYGGRPNDGEALTFSLRLDRSLGSRWGVELEYVYGGEIENDVGGASCPACAIPLSSSLSSLPFISSTLTPTSISLVPTYRVKARRSTVSPTAWYRQSIGSRASLIYSAGVAFVITKSEQSFQVLGFLDQRLIAPTTTELTTYTSAPIVGLDARVSLSDHASIVPGVRVLVDNGGVIMRPSVGLRWQF
jgi:hypothetical protein